MKHNSMIALAAVVALVLLGLGQPQRSYRPPRPPQPKKLKVTQHSLISEPLIAAHVIRWRDTDSPNAGRNWQLVLEIANVSSQNVLEEISYRIEYPDGHTSSYGIGKLERNEPAWMITHIGVKESSSGAPPFADMSVQVTKFK
jgi:hypothetical protein